MADASIFGSILYSHVLPIVMAFIGVILLSSGIMDRKTNYAIAGIILFFAAGILPFLILPLIVS